MGCWDRREVQRRQGLSLGRSCRAQGQADGLYEMAGQGYPIQTEMSRSRGFGRIDAAWRGRAAASLLRACFG
jgi:hypothetical protein